MRIIDALRGLFTEQQQGAENGPTKIEYKSPQEYLQSVEDIRQTLIDILNNGVLGSDVQVPKKAQEKNAVFLPILLRYDKTRAHSKVLHTILSQLDGEKIFDYRGIMDPTAKQRKQESIASFYTYTDPQSAEITIFNTELSSFANGLDTVGNKLQKRPSLEIGIRSYNLGKEDNGIALWKIEYSFDILPIDGTKPTEQYYAMRIDSTVGYAARYFLNPPVALLNNFIFSPVPLEDRPEYIVGNLIEESEIEFLTVIDEAVPDKKNLFRTTTIEFDVSRAIDVLSKDATRATKDLLEIVRLKREQLSRTTIVNIGTTEIRGQKHYIYTAAEKPLVKQESQQKVPSASPALSSFGQLSPEQRRA